MNFEKIYKELIKITEEQNNVSILTNIQAKEGELDEQKRKTVLL